ARMHGNRRHQLDVRPDEDVVLDHGAMLVYAVVVAGNGAGANIHVAADARVAHVGEMVGFRTDADVGGFDFDEIADMHVGGKCGAGTDARVRTDTAVLADRGVIDQRERLDARAGADVRVAYYAIGADHDIVGKFDATFEHAIDVDTHVAP